MSPLAALGVLPVAAFLAAWAAFQTRLGLRRGFLAAAVSAGVFTVIVTEGLTLVGHLQRPWLAIAWAACGAAAAVLAVRLRAWRTLPRALSGEAATGVAVLALLGGLTGVVAWVAAPNTWDSMTYHLARVLVWAGDSGVMDYPTNIIRQLYQPPAAEYGLLQFQVLTGGDHLANFVQWFSWAGGVVGATVLARQLGAGPRGQLVCGVFAATLPMGILQATSTQNDEVLTLWLACLAVFAIDFSRGPSLAGAAGVGGSLGLALLTNGVAYVFALPIGLLVAAALLRIGPRAWPKVALVAVAVVALNGGFWARNLAAFGSPLSPSSESQRYFNSVVAPKAFVSNVIRDLALQVGTTPMPAVNEWLAARLAGLQNRLGISPSDPRTTWAGTGFDLNGPPLDEDYAGNPFQFAVFVLAAGILVVRWRSHTAAVWLLAGTGLAFGLFALLLKWQPWHSRLELPLMAVGAAPIVGVVFGEAASRARAAAWVAVLLVLALPFLLMNDTRSLVGTQSILVASRADVEFAKNPDLEAEYASLVAATAATGCRDVGLYENENSWEYPVRAMLGQRDPAITVRSVFVADRSTRLDPAPGPPPCAIISLDTPGGLTSLGPGREYVRGPDYGGQALFVRRS